MNISRTAVLTVLASVVALLTGCSGAPHRVHSGKVDSVLEQKVTSGNFIYAIGVAASDPAIKSDTQRKALARDAALVKAQYELLSYLKGVTIRGGIKVSRALETDSSLESFVDELIQGAEVVRSEFTTDDGCVVTIRLPRQRVDRTLDVALQ